MIKKTITAKVTKVVKTGSSEELEDVKKEPEDLEDEQPKNEQQDIETESE